MTGGLAVSSHPPERSVGRYLCVLELHRWAQGRSSSARSYPCACTPLALQIGINAPAVVSGIAHSVLACNAGTVWSHALKGAQRCSCEWMRSFRHSRSQWCATRTFLICRMLRTQWSPVGLTYTGCTVQVPLYALRVLSSALSESLMQVRAHEPPRLWWSSRTLS